MQTGDRSYEPSEVVLLTGAGFTKTFGGYLGSEMWAAILNQPEIRDDNDLRGEMLNNATLNFEEVYHIVQHSQTYTPAQKKALTSAVRRVYQEMDQILCATKSQTAISCQRFIGHFGGPDKETRGFFFTLNQDLFIERFYLESGDDRSTIRLPGVTRVQHWFRGVIGPVEGLMDDKKGILLPNENTLAEHQKRFWTKGTGRFMYIKLHGSYAWRSADGSDAMVIGHGKKGAIDKEPLLKWYMSLFKEVLCAGGRKLVVIGYGFGDDHINEVIANAIEKHELKLIVINPTQPVEFRDQLQGIHGKNVKQVAHGQTIWNGLATYYPNLVTEFYETATSSLPPRGQTFVGSLRLN